MRYSSYNITVELKRRAWKLARSQYLCPNRDSCVDGYPFCLVFELAPEVEVKESTSEVEFGRVEPPSARGVSTIVERFFRIPKG